jgi:hypothetical protein
MRIINALNSFYERNQIAGEDSIEINGADTVHPFKKKKEKQADIVLDIKTFPFSEKTADPFLRK